MKSFVRYLHRMPFTRDIIHFAYASNPELLNSSNMAIIIPSVVSSIFGYLWLSLFGKPNTA